MEYIMIDGDRLKIMLCREELESRRINADSLNYSDPDSKRVLEEILQEARVSTGFDTAGYRLLLQLYPCRDGSCELFVTRFRQGDGALPLSETQATAARAYFFDTLDSLVRAAKLISCIYTPAESSVYADKSGGWYLILEVPAAPPEHERFSLSPLSFLCEYATAHPAESTSLYLAEHGIPICTCNAVEQLTRL